MDDQVGGDLSVRAGKVFRNHYDLGSPRSVQELLGGYVNKTFLVDVAKGQDETQYIIRKYNPLTANPDDINFEHTLLRYFQAQNFTLTPDVYNTKVGGSFVLVPPFGNHEAPGEYWAVFECLPGDVRYAFYDTGLTDGEFASAAQTLARLNHAGRDFFKVFGIRRSHPPIMDYIRTFPQQYAKYLHGVRPGPFTDCFRAHHDAILAKLAQLAGPPGQFGELPAVAIHGDFHQGNLTFAGEDVVGVFDFDWARIDLRLFDLAQSIIYFCSNWYGTDAGTLDLDRIFDFLKIYNDHHMESCTTGELIDSEVNNFLTMLEISNLFVLHCMICFFYESVDSLEEEYLVGLTQYLNVMKWLDGQDEEISSVVKRACSQMQ